MPTFSAIDDKESCSRYSEHIIGRICKECGTISMPWKDELPLAFDKNSILYTVGPDIGILPNMPLQDPEAITCLCAVVLVLMKGHIYAELNGLLKLIEKQPEARLAGQGICDMWHTLQQAARIEEDGVMPTWWEVVDFALRNPEYAPKRYVLDRMGMMSTFKDLSDDEAEVPKPVFAFGKGAQRVDEVIRDVEDLPMKNHALAERVDELYRAVENLPTKVHALAETRHWQLAEGTDKTNAVLGTPEPHKFFIVREDVGAGKVDVWKYTRIKHFDWFDTNDIYHLNNRRRQVFFLTVNFEETPRLPWTEKEKEMLKDIVEGEFADRLTKENMDWERIATRLMKAFEGVAQKKDMMFAQSSWVDGKTGKVKSRKKKGEGLGLAEKRVGPATRSASETKHKAYRFNDVRAAFEGTPVGSEASVRSIGSVGSDRSDSPPADEKKKILVVKAVTKLQREVESLAIQPGWNTLRGDNEERDSAEGDKEDEDAGKQEGGDAEEDEHVEDDEDSENDNRAPKRRRTVSGRIDSGKMSYGRTKSHARHRDPSPDEGMDGGVEHDNDDDHEAEKSSTAPMWSNKLRDPKTRHAELEEGRRSNSHRQESHERTGGRRSGARDQGYNMTPDVSVASVDESKWVDRKRTRTTVRMERELLREAQIPERSRRSGK